MFCDHPALQDALFCAEHVHHENSRSTRTLNNIGTKIDHEVRSYQIAAGLTRRTLKMANANRFYEYCPSSEGQLPDWMDQVDHLIRWLTACFEVYKHPDRNSPSKFPVEIFHNAFPEIVDISNEKYMHGFWATHEAVRAYGLDKKVAWEKHTPTLLHFFGAMQMFLPYHRALDPEKFQNGEFIWKTGVQNLTYAKDLFDFESDTIPKAPALRLRSDLDGTSSPSYEGIAHLRPRVS